MIFPLNRERVIWEVVELARLHMCEVLRVPPSAIEATLEINEDRLSPKFDVDAAECKGVTTIAIQEVMKAVYADCKAEMEIRLAGVMHTRDQVLQELRREPEADTSGAI